MVHKILEMLENKVISVDEAKQLLEITKIDNNIMNMSYNSKSGAYLNIMVPKEMLLDTLDKTSLKIKNSIEDTIKNEDILKKIISFVK